jgi:hypothetical protein
MSYLHILLWCHLLTHLQAIDAAERQPKEELDEQKLVDTVKPLIEQGSQILTEANGVIRGLDPDGRIAANAKHKTAAREATPEEYRLADALKDLAGNVTTTIDNAKKKIAGMPHAKKELNPLWNLLAGKHFLPIHMNSLNTTNILRTPWSNHRCCWLATQRCVGSRWQTSQRTWSRWPS